MHTTLGVLIPLPALFGHPWASAIMCGLLREVTQMQDKKKYCGDPWDWGRGRWTDMAFWAVGGLILQVIAWLT